MFAELQCTFFLHALCSLAAPVLLTRAVGKLITCSASSPTAQGGGVVGLSIYLPICRAAEPANPANERKTHARSAIIEHATTPPPTAAGKVCHQTVHAHAQHKRRRSPCDVHVRRCVPQQNVDRSRCVRVGSHVASMCPHRHRATQSKASVSMHARTGEKQQQPLPSCRVLARTNLLANPAFEADVCPSTPGRVQGQ